MCYFIATVILIVITIVFVVILRKIKEDKDAEIADLTYRNKEQEKENEIVTQKYNELLKQVTELSDISVYEDVDKGELKKETIVLKTVARAQQEQLDDLNINYQIEQLAKQMLDDEYPEYKKYYEQYKTLCEDERLAFKNFAEKIEPALVNKFPHLFDGIKKGRLHHSYVFNPDFNFADLNISVQIKSADDSTVYKTSLTECTCPDFKMNGVLACKHMLFLARLLGVLQVYCELHREEFLQIRDEAEFYLKEKIKEPPVKAAQNNT